ncbi:MAG TPA: hypothetical protein VG142_09125 [Trebonia sp.]|nr:hypothetical protein [Trebonia sp.]
MNRSYSASIADRFHASATMDLTSPRPVRSPVNTWAPSVTPASCKTLIASASREACGLIHRPAPSEPKPAQLSRVRTMCRDPRSLSGMRACTTTHRPSQSRAGPKE